jgi:hypothetical protein
MDTGVNTLSSIADNTLSEADLVQWQSADNTPARARSQAPDFFHNQPMESGSEQPWAEFCRELDRPAFLLPITGYAEL